MSVCQAPQVTNRFLTLVLGSFWKLASVQNHYFLLEGPTQMWHWIYNPSLVATRQTFCLVALWHPWKGSHVTVISSSAGQNGYQQKGRVELLCYISLSFPIGMSLLSRELGSNPYIPLDAGYDLHCSVLHLQRPQNKIWVTFSYLRTVQSLDMQN